MLINLYCQGFVKPSARPFCAIEGRNKALGMLHAEKMPFAGLHCVTGSLSMDRRLVTKVRFLCDRPILSLTFKPYGQSVVRETRANPPIHIFYSALHYAYMHVRVRAAELRTKLRSYVIPKYI